MAVYQAKNFDHLLGTPGFSDQLLKNHFTLYQGYVTNSNLFNFLNQNI
jgi:Fe-Mn family superoxide dismutase